MGTANAIYLAWDLGSCSYITLHCCAKVVGKKNNALRTVTFLASKTNKDFRGFLSTSFSGSKENPGNDAGNRP